MKFVIYCMISLIALFVFNCERGSHFDPTLFNRQFKGITHTTVEYGIIDDHIDITNFSIMSEDPEDWKFSHGTLYDDIFTLYSKTDADNKAGLVKDHHFNPPIKHSIYPGFPNPVSDSLWIQFILPLRSYVTILIIDTDFTVIKEVKSPFVPSGKLPAGIHRLCWKLDNENGGKVAPGIYRCIYKIDNYYGYGDVWVK